MNKVGQAVSKKSQNFKNLRLKKLYKPTITKVTKIKNNTKDNIGIFASHTKMRDLLNSKLANVYTDYTFPKRVIGDFNLRAIKNEDYKLKYKEELLQKHKKNTLNISNKRKMMLL